MLETVSVLSVLLSGITAGGVIWLLNRICARDQARNPAGFMRRYLVRDGQLLDCEDANETAFGTIDWADVKSQLEQRFDMRPGQLDQAQGRECARARRPEDEAVLMVDPVPGGQRFTIWEPECERVEPPCSVEGIFQQALIDAPEAVFVFDADGRLCWQNEAFNVLGAKDKEALFDHVVRHKSAAKIDISLDGNGRDQTLHFEVTLVIVGRHSVAYAADVSRLVEADNVRNAFVQTLTKTFADLAAGLAVFDRDRRLVLFNPSILDLTGLPAEFLIARPDLFEFFDRLRDQQVLPEPKDYNGWCGHIAQMIETAAGGHYMESWSLPHGATYRLSGRPHPDGAVAFLIEDISDETALARRCNTQVELRQSVLDCLEDAIAVIGPDGALAFCNNRFEEVVGIKADHQLTDMAFEEILQACKRRFPDVPYWNLIKPGPPLQRFEQTADVRGAAQLTCGHESLSGGFSMLRLTWTDQKAVQPA